MRYRFRSLLDGERVVGAFVDFGDDVDVVLFTDYFFEIPRYRSWKRPVSLDTATAADLEPEVIAAHPSLTVADAAWTGELSPDASSVRGAEPVTTMRLAGYRAVRAWLRGNQATP